LAENLLGSGSGRFRKSDPDPDPFKNRIRIRNTGTVYTLMMPPHAAPSTYRTDNNELIAKVSMSSLHH
jgi:hypothetical protein